MPQSDDFVMTTATQPSNPVTKIELAVIGLVLIGSCALLLPALAASRDTARANICRRNLRSLDLTMHDFIAGQGQLPSALTWPYELLRYYESPTGRALPPKLNDAVQPRPVFYTCPARSDIGANAGDIQPMHYALVVDRNERVHANRAEWKFRDRPLVIEKKDPRDHWFSGHELSPAEAEEQLKSHVGPHPGGSYLESDSRGSSVVRP
jgi:hypothetical protein